MKSENFCFWLQGFFELNESVSIDGCLVLNATQIQQIKTHLALVFKHDPTMAHPKNPYDSLNIPTTPPPAPYIVPTPYTLPDYTLYC